MIVPKSPQIRRMVQYIGKPLLLMALYDFVIVVAYKGMHWEWVAFPHVPLALYGSAIGVILSFRNNSAYGRWWEARTLWGAIVNNSRSLARQVLTGMRAKDEDQAELAQTQRRIVYLQIAFVQALRQHLRGLDVLGAVTSLLGEEDLLALRGQKNVPMAIQGQIGTLIQQSEARGWINPLQWQALDHSLNDLGDAQGGAERIKNTPMPKQYDYYPQLFVQIYCALLPLAMVTNLGWFTPLGSTLVAFIFLALDKIGRDLEDPFDNTVFDVPLTAITTTIETNLRQMLGETVIPDAEKPIMGVLW
ncbi:bestrophin family protein [Granulicella arctica]|uniref:bestrophin family protein n=1 Tax=Granulicella arctica TaxID=940613 RepID=UPI0021E0C226|nr:bestrophin family ion channel [Granulicella arctica]